MMPTIQEQLASVKELILELSKHRDSHIVLIGAHIMDGTLKIALLTKMRPLSRDLEDRLFDGYGPLANFSAKIDMAYALQITTKEFHDMLKLVNKIRIAFAHTDEFRDFEVPAIDALMVTLCGREALKKEPKMAFLKRLKVIEDHIQAASKTTTAVPASSSGPPSSP